MLTTQSLFATEGIDPKSLEFLCTAIEKNNLPGFDYFEFKRAIVQLATLQLDEPTAFKSAFATASTMGLTKEKLLETTAYYRNVVEKEREHFDSALENQHASKVFGRQQEIVRLQDQIDRHKLEITRLQAEISQYLQQAELAETTLTQESERLEKSKNSFEKAHQSVLLTIDRDIELMHQYL